MGTLTPSRNWILGERSLTYENTIPLEVGALSDLIDGVLRLLVPSLQRSAHQNELLDFKGRDPQSTLLPGLPAPHTTEILRIGGECAVAERGPEYEWEPFEVAFHSPFKRFEGAHHIVHSLEVERSGALPPWLPTRLIGIAAPIKPRFFRLGVEHFKSVLSFASLGYTPQVRESLLIDCVGGSIAIRLVAEYKRKGDENPFTTSAHYQNISEILHTSSGFNLRADFERLLASPQA